MNMTTKTKVRDKLINLNNSMTLERISVDIPQSDMMLFQLFADKMGWLIKGKQNLWDEFIKNSPENIDLSDEEIMEEVSAVRYGKVQDNH